MSASFLTPVETKDSPGFIGLKAYSEEDAKSFYGRDRETEALYNLIKFNTLTVVFGKSGTGKTSLLNAGVFPKLREDNCLPFRIRLEFTQGSPDMITQIKRVLRTEIDKYGFKVEDYPGEETLWEYFHKEPLWEIVTPIIILDQFEEIFTLAGVGEHFKKEDLDILIEELSDLIENTVPEKLKADFVAGDKKISLDSHRQKAKVLFAFREDFLAEMETITAKIPSVKYSRFRLRAFDGHQAFEVITKTWGSAIEPKEAKKVVSFLTNETDEDRFGLAEVEPSLLSQVCTFINRERIAEGKDKITVEFLNKYNKELTLRSLYSAVLKESSGPVTVPENSSGREVINPLQVFIEDKLITNEGYRTKYKTKEVDDKLKPGIEALTKRYFLREEGKHLELTHDVLTPLIKEDRDDRRRKKAQKEERKRAFRRALVIVIAITLMGIVTYGKVLWESLVLADKNEKAQQKIDSSNHVIDSSKLIIDSLNNVIKKKKDSLGPGRPSRNSVAVDSVAQDGGTIDSIEAYRRETLVIIETLKIRINELENERTKMTNRIRLLVEADSVWRLHPPSNPRDEEKIVRLEKDLGEINRQLESCKKDKGFEKIIASQKALYARYDSLKLISIDLRKQLESCILQKKKKFGYSYDYKEYYNPKLN